MSDIRHDVVLWYIAFIICWGVISGLITTAQLTSTTVTMDSFNESAANYSLEATSLAEAPSWLGQFIEFQTSVWYINVVILGIPSIYIVWIILTFLRGY